MNKTEKKAMELVMEYERRHGRNPEDVSNKRCGYDIKSKDRFIEVKGQKTKRGRWVILHRSLFKKKGK